MKTLIIRWWQDCPRVPGSHFGVMILLFVVNAMPVLLSIFSCLLGYYVDQGEFYFLALILQFDFWIVGPQVKKFFKTVGVVSPRPRCCPGHYLYSTSSVINNHNGYGMPSAHCANGAAFLFNVYLLVDTWWLVVAAMALLLLTVWQRYHSGMHSVKQILVGILVGLVLGTVYYFTIYLWI